MSVSVDEDLSSTFAGLGGLFGDDTDADDGDYVNPASATTITTTTTSSCGRRHNRKKSRGSDSTHSGGRHRKGLRGVSADVGLAADIKSKALNHTFNSNQAIPPSDSPLDQLPPEPQVGNCEYKLKLVDVSQDRFQHLVTQMKWRILEGSGEASYMLGIADNGVFVGLCPVDFAETIDTVYRMAATLGAQATVSRTLTSNDGLCAAEVAVCELPEQRNNFHESRVAIIGDVQSGKSSLASVLAFDELDNGRGRARLELFRHGHEIRSGKTSSISTTVIGFDYDGGFVPAATYRGSLGIERQSERPIARLLSLVDLAGDEKYHKTTITGLTGRKIDIAIFVISANGGASTATVEMLRLVAAVETRIVCVITKTDQASPANIERTLDRVSTLFDSAGIGSLVELESLNGIGPFERGVVPVLKVSSVSGQNIDLLRKTLNHIASDCNQHKITVDAAFELQIQETFGMTVSRPIVGGVVLQGGISTGDTISVGPNSEGNFDNGTVVSIHRNGKAVRSVQAGSAASFEVSGLSQQEICPGMFVLSPSIAQAHQRVSIRATMLSNGPTIDVIDIQVLVIMGSLRKVALLTTKDSIVYGRQCVVELRFLHLSQYISGNLPMYFKCKDQSCVGRLNLSS